MGSRPVTISNIDHGVPENHGTDPNSDDRAKAVLSLTRNLQTPKNEGQVEPEQSDHADQSVLLRPHRERKVAVLIGQKAMLVLRSLHEALTPNPTASDGDLALIGVVVDTEKISRWIEVRDDAALLVVRQEKGPGEWRTDQEGARERHQGPKL